MEWDASWKFHLRRDQDLVEKRVSDSVWRCSLNLRDIQVNRAADSAEPFMSQSDLAAKEAVFWDQFVRFEMQAVVDWLQVFRAWLLPNQSRYG